MANEITVAGPLSGTPYRFRIAGDRPTVDEQRNIDAYLSAQEQNFQQRYAQVMGAPLDTGEGSGIGNQVGEFFKGIPRGIVGMLESGALGAATLLPQNLEDPAREAIHRAGYTASSRFAPDIGLEESMAGRFGEGLGSFGGLLGVAALNPTAALGLAVSGGAGEASERAYAAGATPEERAQASLLGAGVGASEMIPISLIRILGRQTVGSLVNRISRAGLEGGTEAAQEAAAQIAQNLIEQGIYNPERGTFEGAGESAAIGGGVGALVQGLLDLALPRTRGGGDITPEATGAQLPESQPGLFDDLPEARAPLRPGQDAVLGGIEPELAPDVRAAVADLFPEEQLDLRGGAAATQQPRLVDVPAPAPRQLDLPLPQDELTQGELDLVAPRGAQGDLFREGPPVPVEPAAEPATETAAEPAPTVQPITLEDLDTLGIPRGAAVYQGVRSGALTDDAAIEAALDKYTRATRDADRAARVRNFVEGRRATPQPRPEETEAQLRAAAQPDRTVDQPDGAGDEGGGRGDVGGPRPVVDQPAGEPAAPESGGLGDGQRDMDQPAAAAGDVQPTLTPEAEPTPTPAAPAEPAPTQYDPRSGQIPGQPTRTDAPRGPIPAGIPPATAAPPATPAAPTPARSQALQQTVEMERDLVTAEAQQGLNDWFAANSTPELRAATAEVFDPSATDTTTARDKQRVLGLLNTPFTARQQRKDNPEWGAFRYFNRNPRLDHVLDDIAFDFAEAQVDKRVYASGDGPYYAGKGGDYARGAAAWVEANMSDAAVSYMDERIAEYMESIDGAAIDAAIEARDTQLMREQAEAKWLNETYGKNTKPRMHAALGAPLVPQARRDLERGDLEAALRGLAASTRSPRLAKLAERLLPDARRTAVRVVSAAEMQDLQRKKHGDTGAPFMGLFEAAGGLQTIYLNREAGMDTSTLMHELVHAATHRAIQNQSSPTYRALETLRTKLATIGGLPPEAVVNVDELLAEGMSNEAFRQQLAQINVDGTPVTALQRFTRAVLNAVRSLMGMPARSDVALDIVDQQFELLLRTNLNLEAGKYLSSPYLAPRQQGELMNGAKGRIAEFGPAARDRIQNMLDRTSVPEQIKLNALRGAVPLRNLVDLAKPYIPNAEQIYKLVEEHGAVAHRDNEYVQNTVNKIGEFLSKNPDKVDTFNDMRLLASLLQIDPRKPEKTYRQFRLYYDVLDSNGSFVRREAKGYDSKDARNEARRKLNENRPKDRSPARNLPDPKPEDVQNWRELNQMWRDLGPEGQKAYEQVLGLFEYFHKRTADVLRARVEALFPGNRNRQEQVYGEIYRKVFSDNLILPYQPLQRQGDFWVSYRVLEGDDDVTGVEYKQSFETEADRQALLRELEQIPEVDQASVQTYMSRRGRGQPQPVPLQFAADVLSTVESSGQMTPELRQQLTDLIFDAAPERSYVQQYRARQGVRGFLGDPTARGPRLGRQDTIALLKEKGFSLGRQLADMEYSPKMDGEIQQMFVAVDNIARSGLPPAEAARAGRRAGAYAQVLSEYGDAIRRRNSQWSRNITSGTYLMTLGANVSTAALTFFQFPTIIVPFLAGKHGLRETTRSMGNAMRVLQGSGKTRAEGSIGAGGEVQTERVKAGLFDYSLMNYDLDDASNSALSHYRELQEEMRRRGLANRSITEDILDFDSPDNLFQKVVGWSGYLQHHAERYTRESTAIAAYDMELRRIAREEGVSSVRDVSPEGKQRAADAAIYQAEMTNGTIQAAGAPLWAQGDVGRIIYLYKRFGLHMFNLLGNTALRSLGSNADPADRRVARMQLAGIMGSVALFSGAQGVPFFQTFAQLYDLFFTDDEEENFETMVRLGIGELGYKGVFDYLTNMSVSGRIGLSGMFYREPFNAENQSTLANIIEGVGGPAVGLFLRYTDRVPALFSQGDYYRMTEALMPSAVANPLRAVRYNLEGVQTLRGDPIVGDVSPFSAAAQFLGFAPADYIRQLEQNRALTRIDRAIGAKRTQLLRQLYVARRQGDLSSYRSTMQEIREFNRRNPQYPIGRDTIENSLSSHLESTSRMHHGVLFSTRNEAMLRQMAEQWDAPSIWAQ
jgi:hypothetical protein